MQKLNLSHVEDLIRLKEGLAKAKGFTGDQIRKDLQKGNLRPIVKMVTDQLKQGNENSIEWVIGHSNIQLMRKMNLI